jgi:hypothetical protein
MLANHAATPHPSRVNIPRDQDPAPSRTAPPARHDRRVAETDRRALTLRTLLASGFAPRRRVGRRAGDQELPVDFHDRRLLIPAIAMLLLSVADAFLTIRLMGHGAEETNPLLAFVLNEHPRWFAALKMLLTGGGVTLLVALARARVFNVVRVSVFLYGLVAGYIALIVYEAWLLSVIPGS